jgi:hypothetical protein
MQDILDAAEQILEVVADGREGARKKNRRERQEVTRAAKSACKAPRLNLSYCERSNSVGHVLVAGVKRASRGRLAKGTMRA